MDRSTHHLTGSRWRVAADDGDEPDYRFTLANERTFLAWVRTALGLLAGGVAVRQLVDPVRDRERHDGARPAVRRMQRAPRGRGLPALGRRPAGDPARRGSPARSTDTRHRRGPRVHRRRVVRVDRRRMSEPRALQAERTVLAWSRTVLTVTAAAALIARTADSGFERGAAVTLAAVGLVVALLTSTRRRHAITEGDPRDRSRDERRCSAACSPRWPPWSPPASSSSSEAVAFAW